MLKKKITMAIFAAAMSSGAFALEPDDAQMTDSTDNASIHEQLQALKTEVAILQGQIQASRQDNNTQNEADVALEDSASLEEQSDITVPTNKGQIQNFLFSDIHDEATPLGRLSSTQFALGLLQQRNHYSDKALIFGGYLEINPQIWHGSTIKRPAKGSEATTGTYTYQSGKGIYITTATLYTAANLGRYVTAQLSLSGNEKNTPNVSDALIIFGNLADFPLYATVGKNRIPFGSFSGGGPWTGSLTQMLFRSDRVTNASVAYYQAGLNTNVTLFQTNDHSSDGAYGVSYGGEIDQFSYGINGGYVYNVNGTGNESFKALTDNGTSTTRVGAVNVDLSLTYDMFGVGFGWAQTTNKSDKTNGNYAGAWYFQAGVSQEIYGRSTNFNLAYNGAYNTNSIPITLSGSAINSYTTDITVSGSGVNKMMIASVQRPFFTDNVLFGLEYAYMHMYNHQHANAYTLDISLYF